MARPSQQQIETFLRDQNARLGLAFDTMLDFELQDKADLNALALAGGGNIRLAVVAYR